MQLADAFERWVLSRRSDYSASELERLADDWRLLKRSPVGAVDIRELTKEDAREAIGLFEPDDRVRAADMLNQVRNWGIQELREADVPAHPDPAVDSIATTPTPAGLSTAPAGLRTAPAGLSTAPAGRNTGPQPQVQASSPPPSTPAAQVGATTTSIGAVAAALGAAALVAFAGWFFLIRDSDGVEEVAVAAAGVQAEVANDTAGAGGTASDSASDSASGAVESFSGEDRGDFCGLVRQYDANDPLAGLSAFDGQVYFDQLVRVYASVRAVAPAEIAADVAAGEAQAVQFRELSARYGNNIADPGFLAEIENLDTGAAEASSERVGHYLEQVCGVGLDLGMDDSGAFGSIPSSGADATDPGLVAGAETLADEFENLSDDEAEVIGTGVLDALGVSPELAECLNRELGDVQSALSDGDAALLTQEVCGTTLVEIMQGIGR